MEMNVFFVILEAHEKEQKGDIYVKTCRPTPIIKHLRLRPIVASTRCEAAKIVNQLAATIITPK